MSVKTFKKFPLVNGTKVPFCAWKNPSSYIKKDNEHKFPNHGVPTGKTNDITVVDLDTYKDLWKNNHPFAEEFGEKFVDTFDTLTIETPNKGTHLYFEYTELLSTTINKELQIDIRNDGGYVVGAGSELYFRNSDDYKDVTKIKYNIINDKPIKPMPTKLIEWLLKYVQKTSRSTVIRRMKQKREEAKQKEEERLRSFIYLIPDNDLEEFIKMLPDDYFSDKWLQFTTFCKILGAQDLWDKYCKLHEGYDQINNFKRWDSIENGMDFSIVEKILTEIGQYDKLTYFRLKPIPGDRKQADSYIDQKKLGFNYIKLGDNLVIKSDTGTGKTTSFKHFIANTNSKFISIVSRQSLADEQFKSFIEHRIPCQI